MKYKNISSTYIYVSETFIQYGKVWINTTFKIPINPTLLLKRSNPIIKKNYP